MIGDWALCRHVGLQPRCLRGARLGRARTQQPAMICDIRSSSALLHSLLMGNPSISDTSEGRKRHWQSGGGLSPRSELDAGLLTNGNLRASADHDNADFDPWNAREGHPKGTPKTLGPIPGTELARMSSRQAVQA